MVRKLKKKCSNVGRSGSDKHNFGVVLQLLAHYSQSPTSHLRGDGTKQRLLSRRQEPALAVSFQKHESLSSLATGEALARMFMERRDGSLHNPQFVDDRYRHFNNEQQSFSPLNAVEPAGPSPVSSLDRLSQIVERISPNANSLMTTVSMSTENRIV
ncbi:myogenic-determination protein [Nephila pilipes]|uniref:Myogenic-determination protein n=1 Tax=Nephila pilipes TaxID=299642 RepID=A0A8X6MTE0_NEPPI|nr:myogenic-determination protein [Nephila pilipes]